MDISLIKYSGTAVKGVLPESHQKKKKATVYLQVISFTWLLDGNKSGIIGIFGIVQ